MEKHHTFFPKIPFTFKPGLGILKSIVGKIYDRTEFERVPLLLVQQMVSLWFKDQDSLLDQHDIRKKMVRD